MNVKRLDLWYMPRGIVLDRETKASDYTRVVRIKPRSDSVAEMKIQLAENLKPLLKQRIQYYYVVVVVEKSDGTDGYRTIVPQTWVNRK